MQALLFVCTGNTCRSPMAEAMARALAAQEGLALRVASAGLGAMPGQPASPGALRVMAEEGLDLGAHQARRFAPSMAEGCLVLTMTGRQAEMVRQAAPRARVMTLCDWAKCQGEVADPYGGGYDHYKACAGQLRMLVELGIHLNKEG